MTLNMLLGPIILSVTQCVLYFHSIRIWRAISQFDLAIVFSLHDFWLIIYMHYLIHFMLQPPIYGAYLYDAVYQFAVALNISIAQLPPAEQNRTPSGQEILSQLRDYTYEGESWCRVFQL